MLRITRGPFQFVTLWTTIQITESTLPSGTQESITIWRRTGFHKCGSFRTWRTGAIYVLNSTLFGQPKPTVAIYNLSRVILTGFQFYLLLRKPLNLRINILQLFTCRIHKHNRISICCGVFLR
jgi:hypothetical protein